MVNITILLNVPSHTLRLFQSELNCVQRKLRHKKHIQWDCHLQQNKIELTSNNEWSLQA